MGMIDNLMKDTQQQMQKTIDDGLDKRMEEFKLMIRGIIEEEVERKVKEILKNG